MVASSHDRAKGSVVVVQVASPVRRPRNQRATLIGLGLNKLNRRSVLEDTAAVWGMIRKVSHLVRVVERGDGEV